jgi:acyl-CoA synthetase (AMP-forming)/AMP-acid ligase II
MRLEHVFMERCAAHGPRTFIVDASGSFDYAHVAAHARGIGAAILEVARPGARVGLLLRTGEPFVAAFFGTLLAGCTVVAIDPRLTATEIAFLLEHADVAALIADARVPGLPLPCPVVTTAERGRTEWVGGAGADRDPDAPAVMLPTSGSTSSPRIVELSHSSVLLNARAWTSRYGTSAADVIATPLSACHSFGMTAGLVATLDAGACMVACEDPLPARVASLVAEHRATMLIAASSFYSWLVRSHGVPAASLSSLRLALSGACALPSDAAVAFEHKFGLPIHQTYGLTEASPVVTATPPGGSRIGTVGVAVKDAELRVEHEELQVRGPMVMRGYWRNPEATAGAMTSDGWLRTGDVATIDGDGHVTIKGRLKDLIIRAGEKIYPEEIEDVLLAHPQITDAAVIGVPDGATGEIPVAFVVGEGGSDPAAVIAFCRSRLAAFKVPRRIERIASIPRNPNGKILRRVLRAGPRG